MLANCLAIFAALPVSVGADAILACARLSLLAYHYAIDGLIAAVATYALWRLSLWTIARWDGSAERLAQPTLRTNTVPAE